MNDMLHQGMIRQAKNGTGIPERKVYLSSSKGKPIADVWNDIKALVGKNTERVGYPTQKPLALYERIIRASSNKKDIVLDPFCGSGTTLIAAERLQRKWVGIDIWENAHDVVIGRLEKEVGLFGKIHYKATGT